MHGMLQERRGLSNSMMKEIQHNTRTLTEMPTIKAAFFCLCLLCFSIYLESDSCMMSCKHHLWFMLSFFHLETKENMDS